MAAKLIFVVYYLNGVGFITQTILIAIQVRAYKRIGHSSLLVLIMSGVAAVLGLIALLAPRIFGISEPSFYLYLYGASAVLITLQAILAVIGSVSLFRAFESALAKTEH